MPSGKPGSGTKLGDLCKDCKSPIFDGVYKSGYLQPRCRECHKIHTDSQPSRSTEARRAQYVQWRFGLSEQTYREMVEVQKGVCAICRQECKTGRELAVDHNHITNKIRDLLCYRCNTALGLLEENTEILNSMIDYIERHHLKITSNG